MYFVRAFLTYIKILCYINTKCHYMFQKQ